MLLRAGQTAALTQGTWDVKPPPKDGRITRPFLRFHGKRHVGGR
jgi:hypothetical protein